MVELVNHDSHVCGSGCGLFHGEVAAHGVEPPKWGFYGRVNISRHFTCLRWNYAINPEAVADHAL